MVSGLSSISVEELCNVSGGDSPPTCSSNGRAVVCTCPKGTRLIVSDGVGGVTMTCVAEEKPSQ